MRWRKNIDEAPGLAADRKIKMWYDKGIKEGGGDMLFQSEIFSI